MAEVDTMESEVRGSRDISVVECSAYLTCNKPRVWDKESGGGAERRRARGRQTRRRSGGKKHFKKSKFRDQG